MKYAELKVIDNKAREGYTYSVVGFNLLHWRSHVDEIKEGKKWTGPCGDLTSTVLDLVTRTGEPLENCYRLVVGLDSNKPDHIVGCVSDNGKYYIIGDTTRSLYSAFNMTHHKFFYNKLSEAMPPDVIWRIGVPWETVNGNST